MKIACINPKCDQVLEHIEKYFDCRTDEELAKKIGRSVKLGCAFCEAQQIISVIPCGEKDGEQYTVINKWAPTQDGANWVDSGYNDDTEFDDDGDPRDKRRIHRITPKDNKGFSTDPEIKVYDPRK